MYIAKSGLELSFITVPCYINGVKKVYLVLYKNVMPYYWPVLKNFSGCFVMVHLTIFVFIIKVIVFILHKVFMLQFNGFILQIVVFVSQMVVFVF